MSFHREVLIIAACMAPLGTTGLCGQPEEPVYRGIPLTTLLESAASRYVPPAPPSRKHEARTLPTSDAETAIRQIGTNALPYLVEMIREEPPSRIRLAVNAFRLLGPTASPAIPDLENVALLAGGREAGSQAIVALCLIGTNALPSLGRLCTNSTTRVAAVAATMQLGAKGATIQPLLGDILGPGDATAEKALLGLHNFQPTNALPILTNTLQHPKAPIRKLTVEVIRGFGIQARPAVPALTERLYDSDAEVRQATVDLLRTLAPEMFVTNTPARAAH